MIRIIHKISKVFIATRGLYWGERHRYSKSFSIMHFLWFPWLSHLIFLSTDFAMMLLLLIYFSVSVLTAQLALTSREGLSSVWMSGKPWALAGAQKSFQCLTFENHPPLGFSAMTFSALSPHSYSFPACNREKQKEIPPREADCGHHRGSFARAET